MRFLRFSSIAALLLDVGAVFFLCSISQAQDISALGGDLTSDLPVKVSIQLPSPNISSEENYNFHLLGFLDFHRDFTHVKQNSKKILGPRFNHSSCGGCHDGNGRGRIGFSPHSTGSDMLIKVSMPGEASDGGPKPVPGVGEQLQDHTISGKTKFDIKLKWKKKKGTYPDGTKYSLRRPKFTFDLPHFGKKKKKKVLTSLRMSPAMIGMGLLEAVSEETLLELSDPLDLNGDGISGHVNYVVNKETSNFEVGKFGFKASHPTIKQQSAAAFFNDMGLTNEIFNPTKKAAEIDTITMAQLVFYLQAAGVPPARNQSDPDVVSGKAIFQEINCSGCHKVTLQTSSSPITEVANQTFHPFTDLLLHDMGPDLADGRPDNSASGSEWRTTPLWGLGLIGVFNKNKPGFLHDGRARTIEEAVLWHGGEAENSKQQFVNLLKSDRLKLLKFLDSL